MVLDGRAFTVVGIMPAAFELPLPLFNVQGGKFGERVEIWKPIAFTENEMKLRGSRDYSVIARLRNGVSVRQAQVEIDVLIRDWQKQHRNAYGSEESFGSRLSAAGTGGWWNAC
jgi:hypothetical protein